MSGRRAANARARRSRATSLNKEWWKRIRNAGNVTGVSPQREDERAMNKELILAERIEATILLLRGQKVMLDRDLAALYGVRTSILKRTVTRNAERFPIDFMFLLDDQEVANLRCQFGTSSSWGGTRYAPMAFTEHGVAMLSSVLNSPRAIQVNIVIVRAFVRLRNILATHADLARKLDDLEKKYDAQFRVVFDAMRELMDPPEPPRKQIGFAVKERRAVYRVGVRKGGRNAE